LIKAEHKKWAEFVFDLYLNRILKSSFTDLRAINELPVIDETKSLIVTPNHFSWWDGFFIYWLNKKVLKKKLFILMLEEQLRQYWFFKKVGCYSIDLEDKRKSISSLKYTMELLQDSRNIVTIYPQGEIQSYEQRPIVIKDGINFLSKNSNISFQVLPIAFKIHYANERFPTVYARYGELINSSDLATAPDLFKNEFNNNLNCLDSDFLKSNSISFL
jgi:1-acyl-sn-glycerol-3-phosphate acyltransferase